MPDASVTVIATPLRPAAAGLRVCAAGLAVCGAACAAASPAKTTTKLSSRKLLIANRIITVAARGIRQRIETDPWNLTRLRAIALRRGLAEAYGGGGSG
jgi:hypothetical protein